MAVQVRVAIDAIRPCSAVSLFQAELDAPKDPARLGGEVKLTGRATAYTGAPIGGAKVRYRVTREVRFPPWCYEFFYWRLPQPGAAQEIAHGSAVTGAGFCGWPDRQRLPSSSNRRRTWLSIVDLADLKRHALELS